MHTVYKGIGYKVKKYQIQIVFCIWYFNFSGYNR